MSKRSVFNSKQAASTSTQSPRAADNDEDEEDDYLSDKFLSLPDPSESIKSQSYSYKRLRKQLDSAKKQPKKKDEKAEIQASLSKPIPSDNVGAKLLQKMGFNFKSGKGLGKQGEGIAEPIKVVVRERNLGLGALSKEEEIERRLKAVEEGKQKTMQVTQDQFVEIVRSKEALKQIEYDVRSGRKSIHHLDSIKGITSHQYLWPLQRQPEEVETVAYPEDIDTRAPPPQMVRPLEALYESSVTVGEGVFDQSQGAIESSGTGSKRKRDDEEGDRDKTETGQADPEKQRSKRIAMGEEVGEGKELSNVAEPTESERFEALQAPQQLAIVLEYLRREHLYCLYCGCTYDSASEMEESCPGESRDVH